jgi:hypothetical protein
MEILRKNKLNRHGIPLLSYEDRSALPPEDCRRLRQIRILCIRRLQTIRPGASLADYFLLVQMLDPALLMMASGRKEAETPHSNHGIEDTALHTKNP